MHNAEVYPSTCAPSTASKCISVFEGQALQIASGCLLTTAVWEASFPVHFHNLIKKHSAESGLSKGGGGGEIHGSEKTA